METTELRVDRLQLPVIDGTDRIVLALKLDRDGMKERVLIGAEQSIRNMLNGKDDADVLYDMERPLGSLIFEHETQDRGWWCTEVIGPLSDVLKSEGKYFLYVGKSKAQYARCLTHGKKYAYDHIYLFECDPEYLAESERAVIRELMPIFNRRDNPESDRIGKLLGIDYDAVQSEEAIQCYLCRYANYKKMGLFGFALPVPLYTALEEEAALVGLSCGEFVYEILEQEILGRRKLNLDQVQDLETNLVNTEGYGKLHSRSQEQVKQYLHQKGRMPGTVKLGRDWLIPCDLKFPEDRRGTRRIKVDAGTEA